MVANKVENATDSNANLPGKRPNHLSITSSIRIPIPDKNMICPISINMHIGKRRNFEMELKILWTNIVEPASNPHNTMAPAKVMDMKQKATGNPVDIRNNKLPTIINKASMVLKSIDLYSLLAVHGLFSLNHASIAPSEESQKEHKATYKHCGVKGGHRKFQGFFHVKIPPP